MTLPNHEELLTALASGDDGRAEEAALALIRMGDDALPIVRGLLSSPDVDSRWWATRTIGQIDSAEAVAALADQCADLDPDVRACAVFALGTYREWAAEAVPILIEKLADPSVYVGQMAADSLARIGPPATPTLIKALQDGSTTVRGRAARALAQLADKSSIPALIASLEDESPIVEYYADIALQKMGVGTVLIKV
jgi:HEAT repeat protein